ncbi:MAG TPA: hypothetical protein VK172_10565 [Lentimicrobium sp.]|nr:hypothetical protein [Lentimicrobium sp.]
MAKLPQIPSEFIEPYLVKFMGSMVDFVASACVTQEELDKRNGIGWTVAEVKQWVKGVEMFVSQHCGIHSQYAMMNELKRFTTLPDAELKELCMKVRREVVVEWDE